MTADQNDPCFPRSPRPTIRYSALINGDKRSRVRQSRRSADSRADLHARGYTLAEMLIASVLMTALLSTVWGLMSMYNSFLTAGRTEAEERQLVRALFALLEDDLAAVSQSRVAAADSAPDPAGSDPSVTDQSSFGSIQPGFDTDFARPSGNSAENDESASASGIANDAPSPYTLSVLGDRSSLRLTLRRPIRLSSRESLRPLEQMNEVNGGGSGMNFSAESLELPGDASPDITEFRTVLYQLQPPGQPELSPGIAPGFYRVDAPAADFAALMNNRSTIQESLSDSDAGVDTVTLQALLAPQTEPTTADASTQQPAAETEDPQIVPDVEYIPEVIACEFEYFDGRVWSSGWGKSRSEQLPLAVRVTLTLMTDAEREAQFDSVGSATDETLPTSTPPPGDAPELDEGNTNTTLSGGRLYERTLLLHIPSVDLIDTGLNSLGGDPEFAGEGTL